MNKRLRLIAPAKINWSLDILGRRADGYHLLSTPMQAVGLYDTVTVSVSSADSCVCNVELAGENLALKAWRLFRDSFGIDGYAAIEIKKNIPAGAGLGGGSADAAALLLGARRLFAPQVSDDELAALALRIGTDLPFFLRGGLCLAEGVGERLTPLPGRRWQLLLAAPAVALSTAQVYAANRCDSHYAGYDGAALCAAVAAGDIAAIAANAYNALETAAFVLAPAVGELKRRLIAMGAQAALMSGSGSGVWALFAEQERRQAAARQLTRLGVANWQVETVDAGIIIDG
ncbi:MAG: 4-(cytidine 5'-diphospho)-2-C-methyl-D-erythritol kinase [Bacillota bacterium]|nr:4-(cytidine 5'-diphospho)-2-C-methyl-D-erythritol kinase [Bacillota bacterium]